MKLSTLIIIFFSIITFFGNGSELQPPCRSLEELLDKPDILVFAKNLCARKVLTQAEFDLYFPPADITIDIGKHIVRVYEIDFPGIKRLTPSYELSTECFCELTHKLREKKINKS